MEHWTIVPAFAVRTTGFPIDLLEPLRLTRSTALVQELLAVERELAALRTNLLTEHLPRAVGRAAQLAARQDLKLLSKWRQHVTRRRGLSPSPDVANVSPELRAAAAAWNGLVDRQASLQMTAQQSWTEELATVRAALWNIAADSRVREAIWLSNPDVHRALPDGVPSRSSSIRRIERSLISYIQRLCTKNETNSFFGPINYGRLDPASPANVRVTRSAMGIRRRTSFATQWMAEVLASAIADDATVRPFLKPRRGTRWRSSSPDVLEDTASGRQIRLQTVDAALVRGADGTHTVAQLASALGVDWSATWQRVERLDQAGVLVARLLVPVDRANPLFYLLDWLAALPAHVPARAHWIELVEGIQCEVELLSGDALPERAARLARIEERFVAATGSAARRGQGAMYADRALVFEECLGDLESFVLGGSLARSISQRLQPVFRMWHVAARLRAERDRQAALLAFAASHQSTPGGSVPLLGFLAAARHVDSTPESGSDDRLSALVAELRTLVEARSDGRCARLRSDELLAPDLPPESDACAFTSVDLLIDAPSEAALLAGHFRLVIGEAHAPPLLWVFPTAHYADEAFRETLRSALAAQPGANVAAQVALARDTKIFPLHLPGQTIELRPLNPDCSALPASAVEVRLDSGDVSLWSGGERLRLYPPLKRRGAADPFAALGFPAIDMLPVELGKHTPRVEIDGVVYQRERWVLSGGSLGEPGARDFELFVSAWRWKELHGLPDEVFVRFSSEPKPVYIDFRNHFLIELLDHLARQNDELVITEMLPSSGGTWLPGPGGRYSAEYRATAIADSPISAITQQWAPERAAVGEDTHDR